MALLCTLSNLPMKCALKRVFHYINLLNTLFVFQSVFLSICQSVSQFVSLPVSLSVCLSVCLSVRQSACLPVLRNQRDCMRQ
jgi:hypothetical protein